MRKQLVIGIFALMFTLTAAAGAQEDKSKRPSPPGTAEATLQGKKIKIDYSRPYLKGRHVGQELAQAQSVANHYFRQVWREIADQAQTFGARFQNKLVE